MAEISSSVYPPGQWQESLQTHWLEFQHPTPHQGWARGPVPLPPLDTPRGVRGGHCQYLPCDFCALLLELTSSWYNQVLFLRDTTKFNHPSMRNWETPPSPSSNIANLIHSTLSCTNLRLGRAAANTEATSRLKQSQSLHPLVAAIMSLQAWSKPSGSLKGQSRLFSARPWTVLNWEHPRPKVDRLLLL